MDDSEVKAEESKPAEDDAKMNGGEGGDAAAAASNNGDSHGDGGGGNLHVRPVFLGNLSHACQAGDVEAMFTSPPTGGGDGGEAPAPIPVERVVSGFWILPGIGNERLGGPHNPSTEILKQFFSTLGPHLILLLSPHIADFCWPYYP